MAEHSGTSRWISDEEFMEAILTGGGIKTEIAKILDCTWQTVNRRINDSEEMQKQQKHAREITLDVAEKVVGKNIIITEKQQQEGKKVVDSTDARWYLGRVGKDRGFGQRTELTGKGGKAFKISFEEIDEDDAAH